MWSYTTRVRWSTRWCGVTVQGGVELQYKGEWSYTARVRWSTRSCGVRIQRGVEYKVVRSYNTVWCGVTRWCRGTLQAVAELQYKVLWSYKTRCCGVTKQDVVGLQYKVVYK